MSNRAKCKNCGDVVESKHRQDMVSCSCFKKSQELLNELSKRFITSIDTSTFSGKTISIPNYNYVAMWADPEYRAAVDSARGFALDGGDEYYGVIGNCNDVIRIKENSDA